MQKVLFAKRQAKKIRSKFDPEKENFDIKSLCSELGVSVQEEQFENDISGLILRHKDKYIIAVNQNHSPNRKRFTVAHELGHFILHKDENIHYDTENKNEEIFFRSRINGKIDLNEAEANHFAAELLMPEDLVLKAFNEKPEINHLAKHFLVSEDAMMYRLINLGLI